MPNCTFIFWSLASPTIGEADLRNIVEASARNNQRNGIRSVLFYGAPYFLQYAEGSRLALSNLLWRVSTDVRHTEPILVSFAEAGNLAFLLNSMRLVRIAPSEQFLLPHGDGGFAAFTPNLWDASDTIDFVRGWLRSETA